MTDVSDIFDQEWRQIQKLTDGWEDRITFFKGMIWMARKLDALDDDMAELWKRRIETCPGHQSTQNWCAYCGSLEEDESP